MSIRAGLLGLLICFFGVVPIAAQQLSIQTVEVKQLAGAKGLISVGDAVLVEDVGDIAIQPAVLVRVRTEAANVEVDVSDRDRRRVEFRRVAEKDGERVYLVATPGQFWVDVTAIDFAKNIYARDYQVIEVAEPTPIGPTPGPIPDPPSEALQTLVNPIASKLAVDQEKAAAIGAAFAGFADAVAVFPLSSVQQLQKVSDATLRLLDVPASTPIGADVATVIERHVGIESKDGKWKDRPLAAVDNQKIGEAYRAISWAARKKK